jgi:hypothetical protein
VSPPHTHHLAQVERVIAERPGQSRSLLVKWEGLPYCEATWEAAEDVMAAQGGPEARDEFLTRQQRMQVGASVCRAEGAQERQPACSGLPWPLSSALTH